MAAAGCTWHGLLIESALWMRRMMCACIAQMQGSGGFHLAASDVRAVSSIHLHPVLNSGGRLGPREAPRITRTWRTSASVRYEVRLFPGSDGRTPDGMALPARCMGAIWVAWVCDGILQPWRPGVLQRGGRNRGRPSIEKGNWGLELQGMHRKETGCPHESGRWWSIPSPEPCRPRQTFHQAEVNLKSMPLSSAHSQFGIGHVIRKPRLELPWMNHLNLNPRLQITMSGSREKHTGRLLPWKTLA